MIEQALKYAKRGWPIFPCKARMKAPATPNGFYDATTNEDQIRAWWNTNPEYNIGLATGKKSGVVALDIDPRHHGDEVLEAMLDDHGPLPDEVYESQTGGGGTHFLFRYNGEANYTLFTGVELKSTGTYIVVPPSIHPDTGRRYEWDLARSPLEEDQIETSDDSGVVGDNDPERNGLTAVFGLSPTSHAA